MSDNRTCSPEAAKAFFDLEPRLNDLRRLCWAAKCVAENGQDHDKDLESVAAVVDRAWTEADAVMTEWRRHFDASGRAA